MHFIGTELHEVVSSRPQARAAFVAPGVDGQAVEHELPVRYLGVPAVEPRVLTEVPLAAAVAA